MKNIINAENFLKSLQDDDTPKEDLAITKAWDSVQEDVSITYLIYNIRIIWAVIHCGSSHQIRQQIFFSQFQFSSLNLAYVTFCNLVEQFLVKKSHLSQ